MTQRESRAKVNLKHCLAEKEFVNEIQGITGSIPALKAKK